MDKLKQKREDRAEKELSWKTLYEKAQKEKLSEEEEKQIKSLNVELDALDSEIEALEKSEERAKSIAERELKNKRTIPGAPQDNKSENFELSEISKKYSVAKLFKRFVETKNTDVIDGVEAEMNQEARKELGSDATLLTGQIHIPGKMIQVQSKTKLFDVATEGADNVFTEYAGFIPFLKPEPVTGQLGISVYSGLQGNQQWVRQSGDVAFAYETESSDVNETTPTLDNISISPKRFGGYVDVTMQQMKQSVFALESWLRTILQERYALTVDQAVLNGSGSGNQPTGIFNYSGVNVLSLGDGTTNDMTYKALLSMIRDTKVNNARNGRSGFITNAYGEFALMTTPLQGSGVEGNFIMKPNDTTLVRRPFISSELIPATFSEGAQSDLCGIIYSSNWSGAILGLWGGLDIMYDPYTQKLGGKNRFVCNAFLDVEIEQPLEFTYCKDWDATDLPALT